MIYFILIYRTIFIYIITLKSKVLVKQLNFLNKLIF